jgi:hypothetical protein
MSMTAPKVELGFDENGPGNWFQLDSATRGVLDNTTYKLNGAVYYDVSQYLTSISTTRGKNRELDRFNAGHVVVGFNNKNRYFDPTYTASPFYGQIVPRRNVRISANNQVVFVGVSDDWDLNYSPDGNSVAQVSAYDGFAYLAQQNLTGGTATSQLSGARINAVLDDPNVNWSFYERTIDTGQETLQADVITSNQNVIGYINTIEQTEPGIFFISKNGYATWKDRNSINASASAPVLADDGSGIPYSTVKVNYGSELLYNQAKLSRLNGGTATSNDTTSQAAYGIRVYSATGLLHNTDASLTNLANYLVGQYAAPEFRFEGIEISMAGLTLAQQNTILGLEIGSVCRIKFTPNGITPSISKYAEVIGINHGISASEHKIVLNFQTLELTNLILDDIAVGLLDYNSLSY